MKKILMLLLLGLSNTACAMERAIEDLESQIDILQAHFNDYIDSETPSEKKEFLKNISFNDLNNVFTTIQNTFDINNEEHREDFINAYKEELFDELDERSQDFMFQNKVYSDLQGSLKNFQGLLEKIATNTKNRDAATTILDIYFDYIERYFISRFFTHLMNDTTILESEASFDSFLAQEVDFNDSTLQPVEFTGNLIDSGLASTDDFNVTESKLNNFIENVKYAIGFSNNEKSPLADFSPENVYDYLLYTWSLSWAKLFRPTDLETFKDSLIRIEELREIVQLEDLLKDLLIDGKLPLTILVEKTIKALEKEPEPEPAVDIEEMNRTLSQLSVEISALDKLSENV